MAYTLTNSLYIIRDADGVHIPPDPANVDYQAFLAWKSAGNTPTPYAPPLRTWADQQADAQAALSASDTTMLRVLEAVALGTNTLTAPDIAAFVSYRRNLRSVISAPTGDPSKALPAKPAYPKGT
jgi:hypothetical protein